MSDDRREILIDFLAERDGIVSLNDATHKFLGMEVDLLLEKLDRAALIQRSRETISQLANNPDLVRDLQHHDPELMQELKDWLTGKKKFRG
jgi:hypothetical protein